MADFFFFFFPPQLVQRLWYLYINGKFHFSFQIQWSEPFLVYSLYPCPALYTSELGCAVVWWTSPAVEKKKILMCHILKVLSRNRLSMLPYIFLLWFTFILVFLRPSIGVCRPTHKADTPHHLTIPRPLTTVHHLFKVRVFHLHLSTVSPLSNLLEPFTYFWQYILA